MQAMFEIMKEEQNFNRAEIIDLQLKKIFVSMDVWKELEVFGEAPLWQELEAAFKGKD